MEDVLIWKKKRCRWVWFEWAVCWCLAVATWVYFVKVAPSKEKPVATPTMSWTTASGTATTATIVPYMATLTPEEQKELQNAQEEEEKRREAKQEEREKRWAMRPYLPSPADAPPSLIKVGPYRYSVHYTTAKALDALNAYAITDSESREIWLNPSRTASLRVDLMHEVMHCARNLGSGDGRFIGSGDREEVEVEKADATLLLILDENPQLLAWLTAK